MYFESFALIALHVLVCVDLYLYCMLRVYRVICLSIQSLHASCYCVQCIISGCDFVDLQLLPQGHGVVCRPGVDDIIVFVLELFFVTLLFFYLPEQTFMEQSLHAPLEFKIFGVVILPTQFSTSWLSTCTSLSRIPCMSSLRRIFWSRSCAWTRACRPYWRPR